MQISRSSGLARITYKAELYPKPGAGLHRKRKSKHTVDG